MTANVNREGAEEFIGRRLPDQVFRLLTSAARGPWIFESDRERVLERWLVLVDDPSSHPEGIYDLEVIFGQIEWGLFEDEESEEAALVPFGLLFGGDYVCLDYRGDPASPSVVVWLHEESEENRPATVPVAPTVGGFLRRLEPLEEGSA